MGGGIDSPVTPGVVNCTIVGNSAYQQAGGIVGGATIVNCIIYYNNVISSGSPNYSGITPANCCTTPMPQGVYNITNDPAFIDYANGNFHLQSNSPCINGGNNSYIKSSTDLDGNPRIVDGFVDIGAYEYQTASYILPYFFAQEYGLSLDGSIDSDGDGMNNWQEAIAGTNPTNAASVLKMLSVSNSSSGTTVTWQSVSGKNYYVQRSTNLAVQPAFSTIQSNWPAFFFTDTTATNGGPYFYRVGVQY